MRLVLFDVDGTLIAGESGERQFIRYLVRRGRLGPRQAAAQLYFLARYWPVFGRHVLKKNKAYLTGIKESDVERHAEEFVRTRLLRRLFAPSRERLRRHQAAGDTVALLTGTPGFIAAPLAACLGIEHHFATRCVTVRGRFRARPPLMHPFADEKLAIARTVAEKFGVDLGDTVAYADSIDDIPLLRAVGDAVAVLPDDGLREAAEAYGWEVLDEHARVMDAGEGGTM